MAKREELDAVVKQRDKAIVAAAASPSKPELVRAALELEELRKLLETNVLAEERREFLEAEEKKRAKVKETKAQLECENRSPGAQFHTCDVCTPEKYAPKSPA